MSDEDSGQFEVSSCSGCLIGTLFVALLSAIVSNIMQTCDGEPDPTAEQEEYRESADEPQQSEGPSTFAIKNEGWVACQFRVESKLKNPSSAEFQTVSRTKGSPEDAGPDGYWTISGWVEAKNSFGGKIRNRAVCELKRMSSMNYKVRRAEIVSR
jgi:hypothetical protein